MNLIDTSVITTSAGYPGLANKPGVRVGLDFIQDGTRELSAYLAQAMFNNQPNVIGNPGTVAGLLSGGVNVGSTIYSGAVYFNGEIFLFPQSTISGSSNTYIAASWVALPTDTGSNKTELSDGSLVSIHNTRMIQFTYSGTPNTGNLPDYGNWVQPDLYTPPSLIVVGSGGSAPAFGTGFSAAVRLAFSKNTQGIVMIQGSAIVGTVSQNTLFSLPAGYLPVGSTEVFGWWSTPAETGFISVSGSGITAGQVILNGITTASNSSLLKVIMPAFATN